jgi:hypothetical protein
MEAQKMPKSFPQQNIFQGLERSPSLFFSNLKHKALNQIMSFFVVGLSLRIKKKDKNKCPFLLFSMRNSIKKNS